MEGDIDFFLTGSMPPPFSKLYFQTLQPACILAFLASIPEAILQGPSSLGAGATSCASFITHALPVPWGVPALLKSWSQHMDISMAAARPQPPPAGTWPPSPARPRALSLALGQALGLFMTFCLRVCALALCTQETFPPHQSTHTSLPGKEENSGSDKLFFLWPPRLLTFGSFSLV